MQDPYFSRPEVSNSDLSALKKLLYGGNDHDPTKAYADGHLLDAMITENYKVDYFKRALNGYTYSVEDFENTRKMQRVFYKDPFGKMVLQHCSFQHVSIQPDFKLNYNGYEFTLPARCKWDFLFPKPFKLGGDIKSTAAETQEQFEAACEYFDYFRSRAWYMDIEGTDKDMLIGISKKNHKIFKINIDRNAQAGSKARNYYEKGKEQYTDLGFKFWMFFDGLKLTA
jgi:hypothetical protein